MLFAKRLTGEVARLLIKTFCAKLGIASNYIIATICDSTSVNSIFMCTIKVVHPKIFGVSSYSHTLDHVGEKMDSSALNDFIKGLISLFIHSLKTRLAWSTVTGLYPQPILQ